MKKKKFSSNGNEFRYNARGNSAKYYDDNDGGMDEDSHNEDSEEEERKKKKLFSLEYDASIFVNRLGRNCN